MFIKICGITRSQDVEMVAKFEPDAVGFVFHPPSKRNVRPEDVSAWTRDLPRTMFRVGVFVDASVDDMLRIAEQARLDILQLHGQESCKVGRQLNDYTWWKALRMEQSLPEPIERYACDAFVIDGYHPTQPGGAGVRADWSKAAEFVTSSETPVLLAGGLTPDNVQEALRAVGPWGVDVSSGVESELGIKDPERVQRFIELCRADYEDA